jgi:hypothetical protein
MQTVTYEEVLLVKRHRGTMPVILTCPHDGTEKPPGVDERKKENTPDGCGQFTTKSDLQTAFITQSVAQKILDLTGLSPYVVVASFDRKFIDANRPRSPKNCAFTDPDAKPFYDQYHNRIAEFVKEIREQNANRGFLFDIHGKNVPNDEPVIFLGTDNGGSLLPGFDRDSIFMQHGLQGLLASVRRETRPSPAPVFQYRLSPADAEAQENSSVDGGFTVQRYGVFINSIQIEIADTIRNDDQKRLFLIEDLAFAIINFVRRHAPF